MTCQYIILSIIVFEFIDFCIKKSVYINKIFGVWQFIEIK